MERRSNVFVAQFAALKLQASNLMNVTQDDLYIKFYPESHFEKNQPIPSILS